MINMRSAVIPVVVGTLGTVPRGLEELELRGRTDAIQTIALLRSARILKRVLETGGDLLSLNLQ